MNHYLILTREETRVHVHASTVEHHGPYTEWLDEAGDCIAMFATEGICGWVLLSPEESKEESIH